MNDISVLRSNILRLTREYSRHAHSSNRPGDDPLRQKWIPGAPIPYAGRVFNEDEVEAAVSSALDFWLTLGSAGDGFESELSGLLGVRASLLVNSGSSANLIALSALTSHKLPPHRRLMPGDEVITVAAGFPTTVSPIIQVGAIPVFVDVNPITSNVRVEQLESSYTPGMTKAVVLAHTLGNPFDIQAVLKFCKDHELWLVEDNCDSLGSTYSMPRENAAELGIYKNSPGLDEGPDRIIRWTGSWGDISTQSFYPPHHLTTGEGGAVNIISDQTLYRISLSLRDWGRDCWCPSGTDNSCNKRYDWQLGELPSGYDHKYIYSHLGYNLKPLDFQAAIGRVQLTKLSSFVNSRKSNWKLLRSGLHKYSEFFDFMLPTHALNWAPDKGFSNDNSGCVSDCSWFGFMLLVRDSAPFTRTELARFLDKHFIGNRCLFGGNLLKQPVFVELSKSRPQSFKAHLDYPGANSLMNNALFLGTYPGLNPEMIQYEVDIISQFVESF